MSGAKESQGGVAGKGGQFESNLPAQEQNLPGLERDMAPTSESTKLEGEDGFKEYKGIGKLKGKKVIITGGDSGIGRAVAAQMAREGADITIVYLKEEQPDAEETKRIVEEAGQQCLTIPYNLEDLEGCEKVIKQHIDKFGTIDVLVNNASKQTECKDFSEIDLNIVRSTFQSNVLGMFALTKYSLPHMKKGASIINTTSVTTFRGSANMIDYTSTKGAIVGFTRALAKNLLPKGIRVNAVAPGPVHTPLQPASRPAEEMEGFGSQSGISRPGQPSEIAPTYVFLASAEAALYYGQVLHPYPLGD